MTKRGFAYYRRLPYTRRSRLCVEDEQRFWHAWIEELPGCEVDGATKAEVYASLQEVFEDYIRAKLEWGSTIPEPTRWPKLTRRSRAKRRPVRIRLIKQPSPPAPGLTNVQADSPTRTAEALVVAV